MLPQLGQAGQIITFSTEHDSPVMFSYSRYEIERYTLLTLQDVSIKNLELVLQPHFVIFLSQAPQSLGQ
jgi:hypothetical protein